MSGAPKITLEQALLRTYKISERKSGPHFFSINFPTAIAELFVANFGKDIQFELVENGVLIKQAAITKNRLPAWAKETKNDN